MGIRELSDRSVMTVEEYRPGEIILKEGEPDVSLYLLVEPRGGV